MRVFRSLSDALREGWTVYDRWSGGIVLRQRIDGKNEIAMVDLKGTPLPHPTVGDVVPGLDPEC